MSMPQEIVDKFQQYLNDLSDAIVDTVRHAVPALSPEEQQDAPILMSDAVFSTVLFCPTLKYTTAEASYTGDGCVYKCDILLSNNNLSFNVGDYVGMTYDVSWAKDVSMENSTNETIFFELNHEGDLSAALLSSGFAIKLYYESAYHPTDIRFKIDAPVTTRKLNLYLSDIYTGIDGITTYSVSDEIVSWIPARNIKPQSGGQVFYALNSYPFISNIKDTTNINNWITNNGATNNYTNTYTTPDNKTITVYYGDNYIITHVDNDDPVSYNDVKNALNIAVNQINDDNDVDLDVPDYPIPPPPEPITDDDYIDMGLGVETDGMAMYNMAVLTRDDLIQLITDFESNADTGLSFLPHVLGLYKLGIESSQLLTTNTDKIRLHKEPTGVSAFTSADDYNIVDEQLQVIDCGSITVDRELLLTNTFLDYSPYSSYEMFIPGCGWITLPDTIVGRTISVHIVFDLTTCSCKGVVRSEGELLGGSGSTLATVNGIIGSSVPLSINETGLQRGAIMSGAVQTVTALGTTAMGIGIGNPYMGMSGIAMAAGSLADTHIAGNATYTSTKGGATDYSVFGDGWKAVLKITRPKLEIPDNYGHTVGYVVNKYDTLGNYSGFTVCLNPHITGLTCTSDEKDEIARLLERGVILPSGE